jgi:hypothetical protein
MSLETLAVATAALAAIPACLALLNLAFYRRAPRFGAPAESVSVLIPARNEERSIRRAVESVLASRGVDLEVVVMDDQSDDRTAEIVRDLSDRDPRVRLENAPPLPQGWCGKQHACQALAKAARNPVLLFIDADVTVEPDGIRRTLGFLHRSGAALVSGVPRQITGSLVEKLVVPVIHFILLGFLPIVAMRLSRRPAFAAGCGQLFMTRKAAYERAGGHSAIRASRHDGIALPRSYRRNGLKTDLFDATDVASCRMYRGAGELWEGFAKNADEGMASPASILPWTVLLIGGQIFPAILLIVAILGGAAPPVVTLAALGALLPIAARLVYSVRFRQSLTGALLHPLGILLVVAIQWYSLLLRISGHAPTWKGRPQVQG